MTTFTPDLLYCTCILLMEFCYFTWSKKCLSLLVMISIELDDKVRYTMLFDKLFEFPCTDGLDESTLMAPSNNSTNYFFLFSFNCKPCFV